MMILFFGNPTHQIFAVESENKFAVEDLKKLQWLFGDAQFIDNEAISGAFIGPRAAMVTPWSTNAVEITQNMGLTGILRIEQFSAESTYEGDFDP